MLLFSFCHYTVMHRSHDISHQIRLLRSRDPVLFIKLVSAEVMTWYQIIGLIDVHRNHHIEVWFVWTYPLYFFFQMIIIYLLIINSDFECHVLWNLLFLASIGSHRALLIYSRGLCVVQYSHLADTWKDLDVCFSFFSPFIINIYIF